MNVMKVRKRKTHHFANYRNKWYDR